MEQRKGDVRLKVVHLAVCCFVLSLTLAPFHATAQLRELDSSVVDACSQAQGEFVETACGEDYYFFNGRLSWDPLVAAGPITISIKSKLIEGASPRPLYVEIVRSLVDSTCQNAQGNGDVVMVALGSSSCSGVWESVGPLDIEQYVQLGGLYSIRLTSIEAHPIPWSRSPAVARIRVTLNTTSVERSSWSGLKALFR